MEDIHVLLLDYTSQTALSKAIVSLQYIRSRIKKVTIIRRKNHIFKIDAFDFHDRIGCQEIVEENLSKTLKKIVEESTCQYVLCLYDQDYLTEKIKNVSLRIEEDNMVITYLYDVRRLMIQRPFFIKKQLLKQTSFLLEYQVPFKEAILPHWLSQLNRVRTVKTMAVPKEVVKQNRKIDNHTNFYKQEFIKKYFNSSSDEIAAPSLSIMMANYNMEQYIETALASCVAQTTPPDQVLVIDDGSSDCSYQKIERWTKIFPIESFRQKNSGKARALNQLLPHIKTDFVLELDADDWLDPDAFTVLKPLLAKISNDVSVIYGNLKFWKQQNDGDVIFKGIRTGMPVHTQKQLLSYRFPLGPRIYRTASLRKNGGFPVKTFQDGRLYEDVFILNDLLKSGRLFYNNFSIYNVRKHDASITKKHHSKWSDVIKNIDIG
ncbi:glycosyltransferase family 2 protein [Anoxybacteroides rupiense]|uniref:glycosyltransferase family 2 protein n=1 Tax=Anoxybacteroides rupiense TaxID=311460 RepID=UPI001605B97B|nr:glycosyltransferase family A protein [Anoxybacillus rupiensis]MBB3908957.1 hypothetical protein [Anoxybacillus rupiensis]